MTVLDRAGVQTWLPEAGMGTTAHARGQRKARSTFTSVSTWSFRELIDRAADRSRSKTDGSQPSEVTSTTAKILGARLLIVHDGRCWTLSSKE